MVDESKLSREQNRALDEVIGFLLEDGSSAGMKVAEQLHRAFGMEEFAVTRESDDAPVWFPSGRKMTAVEQIRCGMEPVEDD